MSGPLKGHMERFFKGKEDSRNGHMKQCLQAGTKPPDPELLRHSSQRVTF